MPEPIYTLGHSTRPEEEFLTILAAFGIELVVDIRTVPRSRKNPQYDQASFERWLGAAGVKYQHLRDLGGLRRPSKDSVNTGWRNESFRGYADYMETAQFRNALEQLIAEASRWCVVIVCAEAVPWRCHRSLVGDALLVRGIDVRDIMTASNSKAHQLTPWARVDGTRITYP